MEKRIFLLSEMPEFPNDSLVELAENRKHYVLETKPSLRLRRTETHQEMDSVKYFLTLKTGQGLIRDEVEATLPEDYFNKMVMFAEKIATIEKQRRKLRHEKLMIELDIYQGRHSGILIAKIEILSASSKISLPNWLSAVIEKEITEDLRYSDFSMAVNGVPSPR
jgi:adenylate cyclase